MAQCVYLISADRRCHCPLLVPSNDSHLIRESNYTVGISRCHLGPLENNHLLAHEECWGRGLVRHVFQATWRGVLAVAGQLYTEHLWLPELSDSVTVAVTLVAEESCGDSVPKISDSRVSEGGCRGMQSWKVLVSSAKAEYLDRNPQSMALSKQHWRPWAA